MISSTGDKPLGDFLSDVNERLARVRENLRSLRETAGSPGGSQSYPPPSPNPVTPPARHEDEGRVAGLPLERWSSRLHGLIRDLDSVTTGTDSEFLAIGRSLQDFHDRAGRIRDLYLSATSVLSDGEFMRAIDRLKWVLDKMKVCLEHEKGVDGAVKLRAALDKTSSSLALLTEKHGMTATAAGLVSEISQEITSGIGEVVASLQYHDITRQQVEHVRDALKRLRARLDEGSGPEREASFVIEAGDVCEVQSAQLAVAGDELCSAVKNVAANLRVIARSAAVLADGTREAVRGGTGVGRSFLSELGVWLSGATQAVTSVPETGGELKKVAEELGGLINSLRLINGNIISILTHLEDADRTFSDDIEKAVSGMTFHDRFRDVTVSVKWGIDEIAARSRALVPAGTGRRDELRALAHHTMNRVPGDNVELF